MSLLAQLEPTISHSDFYGGLFLLLIVQIGTFVFSWGKTKEQMKNFGERIAVLERTVAERILPRAEYENRHKDLQGRVETLEQIAFMRSRQHPRET